MNGREQGFLLLSSRLGNPERKPLTAAQLRTLGQRVRSAPPPQENRHLLPEDLLRLGYREEMAARIAGLLSDRELLEYYLHQAKKAGCVPITRISGAYPARLRARLGEESPVCLWAKGNLSLLEKKAVSLVGSRSLRWKNRRFAEAVGYEAARQGFVLVSGNARGADTAGQNGCLEQGGCVISVVADALARQPERADMLFLSEDGFDLDFSAQRALSRNRVIHCLGQCVFVAQSDLGKGGTWDGTCRNLRHGWSKALCYDDGSEAMAELERQGAVKISLPALTDMTKLMKQSGTLFD